MKFALLLPRWALQGSRMVGTQIVVSLCATAGVALLSSFFINKDAPASVQRPVAESHVNELAVLNLLKAGFEPGGLRARALYPTEFEAVPMPALPPVIAATPALMLAVDVMAPPARPARKMAAIGLAPACGADCPSVPAALPPARPIDAPASVGESGATRQTKQPKVARLLGVPLPRFVPATGETIVKSGEFILRSGETAMKSAASIGSSMLDLGARLIP